ncbi:MAG: cell envelope integrity EipB family protein [Pararhizobium sp.]
MRPWSQAAAVLAGVTLAALGADIASAAPGNGLVAHRAVYDLSLKSATDRSGIENMYGRMVYEFSGSPCAGYSVTFRFATRVKVGDDTRMTDQQTTTHEDVGASTFRFDTRSYVNSTLDKEVAGHAASTAGNTIVDLEKPEPKRLTLPLSKFPTQHMLELLAHAAKGDNFYQSRIFDGSEDADQSMLTTTVLGEMQAPQATDEEAKHAGPFADARYWPVTIAYFDDNAKGDSTPSYRIAFKLYPNGITRDLTMDYGDFVLHGELADLTVLKPQTCQP